MIILNQVNVIVNVFGVHVNKYFSVEAADKKSLF